MEWVSASTTSGVLVAPSGVASQYIVLPSVTRSYTDPTLVRTRGQVLWADNGVGNLSAAAGIISWDDINDTPPAAGEVPGPFNQPDQDWLWHCYFYNTAVGTAANPFSPGHRLMGADSIDSRAMRRLGSGKGVLFVVENASASINSVRCHFGVRCLLKE